MPLLTIGGVPVVPDRAELRRLLCKPGCVASVLFTLAVSICILLAPTWRESLRLQRVERQNIARAAAAAAHSSGETPLSDPALPPTPVGATEAGVLTAVLYHDTIYPSLPREPQGFSAGAERAEPLPSVRVTHCEIEGPYATVAMLQREYLATLRTSVLRKRASQIAGADDERLEQADDADDVRVGTACSAYALSVPLCML